MSFNYDANKTYFHNKGFALSLVLKVRFFGTRKWPIDPSSNQPGYSIRSSVQEHSYTGTPFTNFEPILSEGIKKLVPNAPNKTCDNDPIPTKIVKDCINELLPTISNMVNLSLSSGHFPDIGKEGLVRPKLKEVNVDLIKKN